MVMALALLVLLSCCSQCWAQSATSPCDGGGAGTVLQTEQEINFAWDLQEQPLTQALACNWELRCPAEDQGFAPQVAFRQFDTAIEVRLTISEPATRPVATLAGRLHDTGGTFVSEGSSLFLRLEMLPTSTGVQSFAASFTCIRSTALVGKTPEGYVWNHIPIAHIDHSQRATPVDFASSNRISSIIQLTHAFPLFGDVFSAMMISADGFVCFGDPGPRALAPMRLPATNIPVPMIAVFWASTWEQATPGEDGWHVTYGACTSSDGVQGTVIVFQDVPVARDATATYQLSLWSSGAFQISLLSTAPGWSAASSVVVGWQDGTGQGESPCASDIFSGISSCAVAEGSTYFVAVPTSIPPSDPCEGSPMPIVGDARRAQPLHFDALQGAVHQLSGCQWLLRCRPGTIAQISFESFNSTENTEFLLATDPASQDSLGGLTGWLEDSRQFTASSHSLSMVWVGGAVDVSHQAFLSDVSYLKGFYATAECVAVPEIYMEVAVDGPPVNEVINNPGQRSLFRFQAVAGQTYIISTNADLDTVLWILDGGRIVARSDDDGEGDDALIVWSAPESRSFGLVVRGWADDVGSFSVLVKTTEHQECGWDSVDGRLETAVLSELHGGTDLIGRCQQLCVEHQDCLAVDIESAAGICRIHSIVALPSVSPHAGSGHRRLQSFDYSPLSMIRAPEGASILTAIPGWRTFVLGALLPAQGGAFVLSSIQGRRRHCRWYLSCPQVPAAHLPEFILNELTVPQQTVGGVELQAADPVGSSSITWTSGYPAPPAIAEKVPLGNCSTPLLSFTEAIPGQLVGFNLPCTDTMAAFGPCVDDHLVLDSVEQCASVCLVVANCNSIEYGIGERSSRYRFCYLNTATIDGVTGTYGALAGVNYYEVKERKCMIETKEVPHRFVSDSHRLRVDFIDLEATASSFAASFSCAQTCHPGADLLEERLCYSQIPCPSDCQKEKCDCPDADGPDAMSSCHELQARGFESGVQTLIINGMLRQVYCDMQTDGGGWTLVGSSKSPLSDRGGPWHPDLAGMLPSESNDWVWRELRDLYPGQADLRFSCNCSLTADNDVDVRFSDVLWYEQLTSSIDEGRVCFFAGEPEVGSEIAPAPARRDLIAGKDFSWGKRFSSGFLECEDSCIDPSSFAIDFGVGGLSAAQGKSDGTNWGMKRGIPECGTIRGQEAEVGVYQIWFRESTAQYSWRRDDYSFIDLTDNPRSTAHRYLEDDGMFEADLPFHFTFFGQQYASVNVSSNGYVTFSGDHTPHGNTRAIPHLGPPQNVLMPLWTDLNPEDLPSDGQGGRLNGGIFTLSRLAQGVTEWICQWRLPFWLGTHGAPPPFQSQMADFQLVLRGDGTVRFAWAHIGDNPNLYSVETTGMEGPAAEYSWLSLSRGDPNWLRENAVEITPCERGHCPPPNCGCDEHTVCDFQPGRLRQQCKACPDGFSGTGRSGCVDRDECNPSDASFGNVCDRLVQCTNTEGSYECSECPNGYYGQDGAPEEPAQCVACRPIAGCLAETCSNSSNSLCALCPAGTTGASTDDRSCSSCACDQHGRDTSGGISACRSSPQPQGLGCAANRAQMNAIEQLLVSPHEFEWSNCDERQFCRDLSVGTAGRSQLVCIPCSRSCTDYGLCKGAVKSLGGASRLSTSACNPGSLEWVETQSVAQASRCFNGLYSLMTGRGVGMLHSSNGFHFDIDLSISGSIAPSIASASGNRTVAVYESCQWRGYRVSTCSGGTYSVHHLVIVDTSTSPMLNLTSVDMDLTRDDLTVSHIGPGSAFIVLTFSTRGASSCLPEETYRKIFYQAISCVGLPGHVQLGPAPPPPEQSTSCTEDPYDIIGGQTCEATLSAVLSFGESCSSPVADLSRLFVLVGIGVPPDLMGSSFAEICPVACDACSDTGTSAPSFPAPAPPEVPAHDPDCVDDRDGALMRAHQTCEALVQSAVQMGQITDCSAPLSQLGLLFSIFGIAINDEMADGTVNDLCPIACEACTAGRH